MMLKQKEACARVIELWSPIKEKVYWLLVSIISDRGLAEDAIQEALITAMDKFHTLRDEKCFEAWFTKIAIRKAYELMEPNKHLPLHRGTDPVETEDGPKDSETLFYVDETLSGAQYRDLVFQILTRLHPEDRKYLFYLRYVQDKSIGEIVDITGLKEGTLKSIYSRMRKEIGGVLEKEYLRYG